jgi:hypothetical protein
MLLDMSIAGKISITMAELKELAAARGIDIRALAEARIDKANRNQGGIRTDETRYNPEAMLKGMWNELFVCEVFGQQMDVSYRPFGDHFDFTLPLPCGNNDSTKVDGKCGRELIVNANVLGKADVYILSTGDLVNGFSLKGWMTAADMATFVPERRQGPAPKHVCSVDQLRSIDELKRFIATGNRITNVLFKGKEFTW